MNRRTFFRFFGRASGTAAAVVVGGAAVLPKVTGAVDSVDELIPRLGYERLDWIDADDDIRGWCYKMYRNVKATSTKMI